MNSSVIARVSHGDDLNIKKQLATNNSWGEYLNGVVIRAKMVALPAIALVGFSSLQTAGAGPMAGSLCLLACIPLIEAPPLLAICIAACGMAAIAPTP